MRMTIETNEREDITVKMDGFNAKVFCMATNEILNSVAKRVHAPSARVKIEFLTLMAQTLLADEDC